MKTKEILFLPREISCPIGNEHSVLAVGLKNGVEIPHSCGGMGSCTTCRDLVERADEALPPSNELELDIAEMREFADNERLSCQLPPVAGLVVRLPDSLDSTDFE
jgi:ferredoxin, 2Fe-2S